MYNDTVSDFLTRLRNAYMAEKQVIKVRYSGMVQAMAEILKLEGHLSEIKKDGYFLEITLNMDSPLTHIKRVSKPGIRRYIKHTQIPRPRTGLGMVILSTPKGILTGNQARKQKVGGELLCEVW